MGLLVGLLSLQVVQVRRADAAFDFRQVESDVVGQLFGSGSQQVAAELLANLGEFGDGDRGRP